MSEKNVPVKIKYCNNCYLQVSYSHVILPLLQIIELEYILNLKSIKNWLQRIFQIYLEHEIFLRYLRLRQCSEFNPRSQRLMSVSSFENALKIDEVICYVLYYQLKS